MCMTNGSELAKLSETHWKRIFRNKVTLGRRLLLRIGAQCRYELERVQNSLVKDCSRAYRLR